MLFQRPYILKSSGGAYPRTTLAARPFGAPDCPPPNKSNLATALSKALRKSCPDETWVRIRDQSYVHLQLIYHAIVEPRLPRMY